jgi:hypothetical protein
MGVMPDPFASPLQRLLPFGPPDELRVPGMPEAIHHSIEQDVVRFLVNVKPVLGTEPQLPSAPKEARCREKACVFPSGPSGLCLHHVRLQKEPELYQSRQPTLLVVERSRYDVDTEEDGELSYTRGTDRRRLAAERLAFLEE